ncbi:unnamed protein product [Urochloa humidicola]
MNSPNEEEVPLGFDDDIDALDDIQSSMHLAVVATPIEPAEVRPSVSEIFAALEKMCGEAFVPHFIWNNGLDFFLQFHSEEIRDAVRRLGVLQISNCTMTLSLWSPYYRDRSVPWDTKVLISVSGIPPDTSDSQILEPLLSAYCDISSTSFKKAHGICHIEALASTESAIPTSGTIVCREITGAGTTLRTYPVLVTARAAQYRTEEIKDHPLFKAFCEEYWYYHWTFLLTAFEFGVDPDVLYEVYLEQAEEEDIAEGRRKFGGYSSSSDFSADYDGYSARMYGYYSPSDDLSDREPADWRGSNI